MTLAELKTELLKKGSVAVGNIIVDYQEEAQAPNLTYPIVIWNLAGDGSRFRLDTRSERKLLNIDVFICIAFNPNTDSRITKWDTAEALLRAYLAVVDSNTKLRIMNLDEIEGEYYPFGAVTVEGEIGIRYRIALEMIC